MSYDNMSYDNRNYANLFERVDQVSLNDATKGRPDRWYLGSFFIPRTDVQRRLNRLQRQNQSQNEQILSSKAKKIQQITSALSEWFPVPLLDQVMKELTCQFHRLPREKSVPLVLGYVEAHLRQQKMTIQWAILQQINATFNTTLTKKDYHPFIFLAKQRLKLQFDAYAIVKRLVGNRIISHPKLSAKEKRKAFLKLLWVMKKFRQERFVAQDLELLAIAVTRAILNQRGAIDVPPALKRKATRLNYRVRKIRKLLKEFEE